MSVGGDPASAGDGAGSGPDAVGGDAPEVAPDAGAAPPEPVEPEPAEPEAEQPPPEEPEAEEPPPEEPEREEPQPPLVACAPGETRGPRGTCYVVFRAQRSWAAARRNCIDRGDGWDLASIRSAADSRVLGQLITSETWLGASDANNEGRWVWVIDGAPFWTGDGTGRALNGSYNAWRADEPNGGAGSDCARAFPGTQRNLPDWSDLECDELRASVCEGPPR